MAEPRFSLLADLPGQNPVMTGHASVDTAVEALRMGAEVYHALKSVLKERKLAATLAPGSAEEAFFDAVIATALIVNGGIYRHEFVTTAVIDGLMRVQMDTEVPVFSAVLTPRDFHEHGDHVEFFRQHFVKKGVEVAHACLSTLDQHAKVDALLQAKAA